MAFRFFSQQAASRFLHFARQSAKHALPVGQRLTVRKGAWVLAAGLAVVLSAEDGHLFQKVYPKLEAALQRQERHEHLPKRSWFIGEDQESNQASMDRILDEAIAVLAVSDINEPRLKMKKLDESIAEAQRRIDEYRQAKITAPANTTFGLNSLPGLRTKKGYEDLIAEEQENIHAWRQEQKVIREEFRTQASVIGLHLSDEALGALLDSVSGDDMITMGVVFQNVKSVTLTLEQLTNESGESLDAAQRYYGMYLVLLKTLDRMQKTFMYNVAKDYEPQLKKFIMEAEDTILEAERAIKKKAGDYSVLSRNIESNRLTIQAAKLYIQYLEQQKAMIKKRNEELEHNLVTAQNTYRTVAVSRSVATFLHNGRETFTHLMNMTMPELRVFENEALRRGR